MFDANFIKFGPMFKILSRVDFCENSVCIQTIHDKDFHLTCNLLPDYLVTLESAKVLPNFSFEHANYYV